MDPDIAKSLEPFVSWTITVLSALLGFGVALAWMLCAGKDPRRKRSALIDAAWTLSSGLAIVVALWTFDDLVWHDYQHVYESRLESSWDQLAKVDGRHLVALNCPTGNAGSGAPLSQTPASGIGVAQCGAASAVLDLSLKVADATKAIEKSCGNRDTRFSTRDYTGMDVSLMASCYSQARASSTCMQSRCNQEHLVMDLMVTEQSDAGQKMRPDTTVIAYRKQVALAASTNLHAVYEAKHPAINKTFFYALVPIWAFVFGARMARPGAEIIDPTQNREFPVCESVRRQWRRFIDPVESRVRALFRRKKRTDLAGTKPPSGDGGAAPPAPTAKPEASDPEDERA